MSFCVTCNLPEPGVLIGKSALTLLSRCVAHLLLSFITVAGWNNLPWMVRPSKWNVLVLLAHCRGFCSAFWLASAGVVSLFYFFIFFFSGLLRTAIMMHVLGLRISAWGPLIFLGLTVYFAPVQGQGKLLSQNSITLVMLLRHSEGLC